MLTAYLPTDGSMRAEPISAGEPVPSQAVWLDLSSPDQAEDEAVESLTGISVPTRDEMLEIEVSSRLYAENGALYMTATLMCASETPAPKHTPVTFILTGGRLVTVRYDDPRPFAMAAARLGRVCPAGLTGEVVMMDLLDAIIDRAADILERSGSDIEAVSRGIFESKAGFGKSINYRDMLKGLGREGELASKVRESLVSLGRLLLFLANIADQAKWPKDQRAQVKSMARDVQSLSDHATYLTDRSTFLLDALLGMVSLEQNNIIKLFSVAAVVLMPPTLVASIYGMNFEHMPELKWTFGYPMALGMMLVAAVLPYLFFKWKKWL
jgi:magnesium transporter